MALMSRRFAMSGVRALAQPCAKRAELLPDDLRAQAAGFAVNFNDVDRLVGRVLHCVSRSSLRGDLPCLLPMYGRPAIRTTTDFAKPLCDVVNLRALSLLALT